MLLVIRRLWLLALAAGFALAAGIAFTSYYIARPTTLAIAVGPPNSEDVRVVAAIGRQLGRERAPIRFRVIERDGAAEAAAAIDKGDADLAVVRRDLAMPKTGEAVAILRRNVVGLIAAPGAKLEKIGDLAGRKIGIVGRERANIGLLQAILTHYEVPASGVASVEIDPENIAGAVRDGAVDVLLVAAPITSRRFPDAVAALSRAGEPPVFLPIEHAEAIAQHHGVYDSTEIVAAALGG
jgi:TRAP-type uncharacterized transport system substrate-binding protein